VGPARRLLLTVILTAAAATACGGGDDVDARLSDPGPVQEGGSIPVGGPQTGTSLPTTSYELLDGGTTDFAAYRGRPLVVNVWATWCVPCLKEMPAFEEVHQEVGIEVQFVGLNSRDDRTEAQKLATRTGVTYDLLYDPAAGFVADVGVVSLPSTLFVDEHGTVVATKTGKMDAGQLRAKLAELFGA
jgi:thiol-disulfide isomerase/thioredoxin